MSKENLPKAEYKGQIKIGDLSISCAVLENGERVLVDRSLANVLGIKGSGAYWQKKKTGKGAVLPEYISAQYLAPYISDKVRDKFNKSIVYTDSDKNIYEGVSASLLVDICDIWHLADKKGALKKRPNAKIAAETAYIIFKGFAEVGITALVDEATGYQYDREKNELQKILSAYISEEVAKWQLTFKIDFYKELFRLWGQPFNPDSVKKPSFVGRLTNKFIYEVLPNGVLETLKENTPKTESGNYKYRLHQSLTPEIGREHLKTQIIEVTALMSVCDTKEQFLELFNKKYAVIYQHRLV